MKQYCILITYRNLSVDLFQHKLKVDKVTNSVEAS